MESVKKPMESWLVIPSGTNILASTIAKPRGVERIFFSYTVIELELLFLF